MRAVVLRFARADVFNLDALHDPPHAQPREPRDTHRSEGCAVVHAHDLRAAVVPHERLEGLSGGRVLLVAHRPAAKHVAAVEIGAGQRDAEGRPARRYAAQAAGF